MSKPDPYAAELDASVQRASGWRWISIRKQFKPMAGTRVLLFTPVQGELRYRVCPAEMLSTFSEATHWVYLRPPHEYWESHEC